MKGLHAEILDFLDFKIPKDWAMILCKASNTKCPTSHLTCICHVFLSWWWQNLVQVTIFVLLPIGCWMTPRRKPKQDVISQCTTITPSHPCPLKNHSGSRPKPMSSVLAALTAISPNQNFSTFSPLFSVLYLRQVPNPFMYDPRPSLDWKLSWAWYWPLTLGLD